MGKRLMTSEFISKSKLIHGDKYDYSKCVYVNNKEKVCIKCPEHGDFLVRASSHIKGIGCKICSGRKLTTKLFIDKANVVHKNKYDYSKTNYVIGSKKVIIICKIHGEFSQNPGNHLLGRGCEKCASNSKLTTEIFVERSNKIHNDKYDYSKSVYVNSRNKVSINCPIHGIFKQKADAHINGDGCPTCSNEQNVNETKLLNFIRKTFPELLVISQYNCDWLGRQSIDIYIPKFKIGIEYQGDQHFKPIKFFGGEKRFKQEIKRDNRKYNLCNKNGLILLYFTYNKKIIIEQKLINKVYTTQDLLVQEINKIIGNE
jgi:hypothetical protein